MTQLEAFLTVMGPIVGGLGLFGLGAYLYGRRADTKQFLRQYQSALKQETTANEKEGVNEFDQLGNIGDLVRLYWDKNKRVYKDNTEKIKEVTSVGNPLLFNLDYGWGEYGIYLPLIIQQIRKRGDELKAGAYSRSDEVGYAHRNTVFSVSFHNFLLQD